jgi:small subunit ribosomal protein S16
VGKKKQPAYRIIVADSHAPREGAFIKIFGHYNPLTNPATLTIKEEEAVQWLQKGAQPSDTAAKLLTRLGVMEKAGLAPVRYSGKDVPPGRRVRRAEAPAAAARRRGACAAPGRAGSRTRRDARRSFSRSGSSARESRPQPSGTGRGGGRGTRGEAEAETADAESTE